MKVNYLNKLIKSKNKIINDYEHLSELFKEKFIHCINKDKEGESINEEKLQLQEENEALMEYLSDLKNQNNYYKNQIYFQSNSNSSRISDIRIELQSVKNKIDKSLNRSQIIRSKNNNRDEIFELQSKINECNNDNKEFDVIKEKYEILEKKFIIKNNIIKKLENENQNLYKIFNSLNKNYEKIYLSNQQLKSKIKKYEDLYEKYENDRLNNMNGKI
jgi:chromosome segregation ATPase